MLDWLIPAAHAQGGGAPSPAAGATYQFLFFVTIIAIFYFIVWRPQQKRMRQHQAMIQSLQKGDKIVTSGGIHGQVFAVEDRVLWVDIAPNTRVKLQKENVAGKVAASGEATITEPK